MRSLVFRGQSVEKIVRANLKWHKNVTRIGDRTHQIGDNDAERTWVALFNLTEIPRGVTVSCVTSQKDLREEGKQQGHCVGRYAYECLYENLHVLSLRGADGSWQSTLGLMLGRDGRVRVKEHKLSNNDPLNSSAKEAERYLVDGINNGMIAINIEQIEQQRIIREKELLKNRHQQLLVRVGFDPFDAVARENAYDVWHHTLRRIFSEPDRRKFFDEIGLDRFVVEQVSVYARKFAPAA
jgi:hypothetical protein